MPVSGHFFWMQNGTQPAGTQVNPLLQQAQNAIARRGDAAGAVSREMAVKIQRNEEETKVSPAERALRKAKEDLLVAEQDLCHALSLARLELGHWADKQEGFTDVLDGTADYGKAMYDGLIDYQDRDRFAFTDFETYLQEKGYQGDATKKRDFFNPETGLYELDLIAIQDATGQTIHLFNGQVLVDKKRYSLGTVLFADQVPYYEQWKADKRAFLDATMKEYAAEKLPQVQSRIEEFPGRVNDIVVEYARKREEILARLPEGALKEKHEENAKAVAKRAEGLRAADAEDGQAILALLNKMLDEQREFVLSLGGTANKGFYGRIKGNCRLPEDYYA